MSSMKEMLQRKSNLANLNLAEQISEKVHTTPSVSETKKKEKTVRLTFDIPESLHTEFKVMAARQGKSIKSVIMDFMNNAVKP